MKIKSCPTLILSGFLVLPILLAASFQVYASETDVVNATVTAEVISVSLNQDGGIPFGVVAADSYAHTASGGVGEYTVTATNDGSVAEDFQIMSTDSTDWTLVLEAARDADDEYSLNYCVTTCDTTPVWADVGIDPAYEEFATGVAKDGTADFDLRVGTPTVSTSVTQQSIVVTVLAVAN